MDSIDPAATAWLPPRDPVTQRPQAPWHQAARRRRLALAALTAASVALSTVLFLHTQPEGSHGWIEGLHMALFVVLSTWVVTGFATALMGFWVHLFGDRHSIRADDAKGQPLPSDARTAIVMPICHEDVDTGQPQLHLPQERFHARLGREIREERAGVAVLSGELPGQLVGRLRGAAVDRDPRAGIREFERDRAADATSRAGDERRASDEIAHRAGCSATAASFTGKR